MLVNIPATPKSPLTFHKFTMDVHSVNETALTPLEVYKQLESYLVDDQMVVLDHGSTLTPGYRYPLYEFLIIDRSKMYDYVDGKLCAPTTVEYRIDFGGWVLSKSILNTIIRDNAVARYRKLKLLQTQLDTGSTEYVGIVD